MTPSCVLVAPPARLGEPTPEGCLHCLTCGARVPTADIALVPGHCPRRPEARLDDSGNGWWVPSPALPNGPPRFEDEPPSPAFARALELGGSDGQGT